MEALTKTVNDIIDDTHGAFFQVNKAQTSVSLRQFVGAGASANLTTAGFRAAVTALAGGPVELFVPRGTYLMNPDEVLLPADFTIRFQRGAILTTAQTGDCNLFRLENAPNVTVHGGVFTGATNKIRGFSVENSDNLTVLGARCDKASLAFLINSHESLFRDLRAKCPRELAPINGNSAINFHFSNYGTVEQFYIEGYAHGIQYWGGDGNPPDPDFPGQNRPVPLTVARGTRGIRVRNGRTYRNTGAGVWGSMGDDIVFQNIEVDNVLDVGLDMEATTNSRMINCRAKDGINGNFSTFFDCDNIEIIDCKSIVSSPYTTAGSGERVSGFKPLGIYGGPKSRPGRLSIDGLELICESGIVECGYEDGGYDELYLNNIRTKNVRLRFNNVAGHKQFFTNSTLVRTVANNNDMISLGSLLDKNGNPPYFFAQNNKYVNESGTVDGSGMSLFHNPATMIAARSYVYNQQTKGLQIDAVFKPSNAPSADLAAWLHVRDNEWGSANPFFEPPQAGRPALRDVQHNNFSSPGVQWGPGVLSKSSVVVDMRTAVSGEPIVMGDNLTLVTDKRVPAGYQGFQDISVFQETSTYFYIGSLRGTLQPDNRDALVFTLLVNANLRADRNYEQRVRIGSRDGLTTQQEVYGLTDLAQQVTSVRVYQTGGASDQIQYKVYVQVAGNGFHAVRLKVDEYTLAPAATAFLTKTTAIPAGTLVFDSSTSTPQLWVPRTGLVTGSGGNGGTPADLSNYYTRDQTYSDSEIDSFLAGKANGVDVPNLSGADAITVAPGKSLLIYDADTNAYYLKTNDSLRAITLSDVEGSPGGGGAVTSQGLTFPSVATLTDAQSITVAPGRCMLIHVAGNNTLYQKTTTTLKPFVFSDSE